MKKKIIFMIIDMNVGGTEKALLNMISEIPKEEFEITILMLEKKGGFLDFIPSQVHLEYFEGYEEIKDLLIKPPLTASFAFFIKGRIIKAMNIVIFHLISKIIRERSIYFKYLLYKYPVVNNNFDIAVAYAGPMEFISYFVLNKVKAKKKIQWIHFDITKIGLNLKFAGKMYEFFDRIFVVSEEGKKKLISYLPHLKDKTDTFYNIISTITMEKMANEENGFTDNFDGIRILTVGRLTKEKGQDLTIPVLKKLKQSGYNVRWYCVGEGHARKEYEALIEQFGVKNDFILLGAKTNPYPFMKQCDIYVQPSRHEGYCITLAEAKNFHKPIVSTNFTGASEQIKNNQSGLIVNFDENQMFHAIKRIVDDQELRTLFEKCSQNKMLDTSNEIQKLVNIV